MENTQALGTMYVILVGLALLLALLWIALPILVFSIREQIKRVVYDQRRTIALLEQIARNGQPPPR